MNIYFILLVFIILYMFKIMCNRIEGLNEYCHGDAYCCMDVGCPNPDEIMKDYRKYEKQMQELREKFSNMEQELNEKLGICNTALTKCQSKNPPCPSPSCPSCPSPSCPSPPPASQVFCDPTAFPAQFCPGEIPCPQCGRASCPCPITE